MNAGESDIPVGVAALVRERREALGLTVEQAIASIQPDRALELVLGSYWHDLEQGRPVPQGCLPHIARALQLDVNDLMQSPPTRECG